MRCPKGQKSILQLLTSHVVVAGNEYDLVAGFVRAASTSMLCATEVLDPYYMGICFLVTIFQQISFFFIAAYFQFDKVTGLPIFCRIDIYNLWCASPNLCYHLRFSWRHKFCGAINFNIAARRNVLYKANPRYHCCHGLGTAIVRVFTHENCQDRQRRPLR